ncbi:MAG: type VI secretion system protein TssA [Deltaproteobacteria bacterium]|jgi:type VI secretion system protein VasJ|nr:type VI secretion system protein TssA [Deltaproteobacteria bacterium]
MLDETIISLGREPVPGDSPCGQDVRGEADYLAVQEEIERLSAPSDSQTGVNWPRVVTLGQKILAQDSKDLTVAVYLAVGLLETEPVTVLTLAADFLAELMEKYWDNLFPPMKRLRARKNSLDWFREKALVVIKRFDGQISAAEQEKMTAALKRLDKISGDLDLVNFMELVNLAKNLPLNADPAPEAAQAQAAQTGAAQTSQGSPPAQTETPARTEPAETDPKLFQQALISAAGNYLSALGTDNPWHWKLERLMLWLAITAPPPAEGSLTRLPPPEPQVISASKKLLADGQAAEALNSLEDIAPLYPFWLDLPKLMADCLLALGHETAGQALRAETAVFFQRFPALRSLAFEDNTPLVSRETREWLTAPPPETETESGADQELKALAEGDPFESLSKLAKNPHRHLGGRSLTQARIIEARLWLKIGRQETAAGLADWLMSEVEKRDLGAWEPPLAAEVLKACHQIYLSLGAPFSGQVKTAATALALIDPDAVLDLPAEIKPTS